MGVIWEASESQSRPEEARGSFEPKIDTPPQQNVKVPLKCQFYEAFLRVGVIKYCKLQGQMAPGSVNVSGVDPWALLSNTVRTPQCKHCLGKDEAYPLVMHQASQTLQMPSVRSLV